MRNNTSISYNDTIKEKNIDVPNVIITCLIINTLTNEEITYKKSIYVKSFNVEGIIKKINKILLLEKPNFIVKEHLETFIL